MKLCLKTKNSYRKLINYLDQQIRRIKKEINGDESSKSWFNNKFAVDKLIGEDANKLIKIYLINRED